MTLLQIRWAFSNDSQWLSPAQYKDAFNVATYSSQNKTASFLLIEMRSLKLLQHGTYACFQNDSNVATLNLAVQGIQVKHCLTLYQLALKSAKKKQSRRQALLNMKKIFLEPTGTIH